jgi:hypothetical protein
VGDWTKQRRADGSDEPLPDALLAARYEEPPPHGDTAGAPIFHTDEHGEIHIESAGEDSEDDIEYIAQVCLFIAASRSVLLIV